MLNHKLYRSKVYPTNDVLDYFVALFASTPLEVGSDFGVILGSSYTEFETFPTEVYEFKPGSLGVWYDSISNHSSLILPLRAGPKAISRWQQIGDEHFSVFIPFVVLADYQKGLRHRRKAFLNSISDSLIQSNYTLTFHGEQLIEYDNSLPIHSDFIFDIVNRSASIFAEELQEETD